jgi:hypothetical protein
MAPHVFLGLLLACFLASSVVAMPPARKRGIAEGSFKAAVLRFPKAVTAQATQVFKDILVGDRSLDRLGQTLKQFYPFRSSIHEFLAKERVMKLLTDAKFNSLPINDQEKWKQADDMMYNVHSHMRTEEHLVLERFRHSKKTSVNGLFTNLCNSMYKADEVAADLLAQKEAAARAVTKALEEAETLQYLQAVGYTEAAQLSFARVNKIVNSVFMGIKPHSTRTSRAQAQEIDNEGGVPGKFEWCSKT